jgi:hypothetical protein
MIKTLLLGVALCFGLSSCGEAVSQPLPTAHVLIGTSLAETSALPSHTPTTLPTPTAQPSPTTPPTPATDLEQYRVWMHEARMQYPYSESLDAMWSVMICESSGNPTVVVNGYYGLFQYSSDTWLGEWNPYREQPILDPKAQIFATAKAWYDGNQHWWGCR